MGSNGAQAESYSASEMSSGGRDSEVPEKAQSRRVGSPPALGGGQAVGDVMGAGRRSRMSRKVEAGVVRTRVEVGSVGLSASCYRKVSGVVTFLGHAGSYRQHSTQLTRGASYESSRWILRERTLHDKTSPEDAGEQDGVRWNVPSISTLS